MCDPAFIGSRGPLHLADSALGYAAHQMLSEGYFQLPPVATLPLNRENRSRTLQPSRETAIVEKGTD